MKRKADVAPKRRTKAELQRLYAAHEAALARERKGNAELQALTCAQATKIEELQAWLDARDKGIAEVRTKIAQLARAQETLGHQAGLLTRERDSYQRIAGMQEKSIKLMTQMLTAITARQVVGANEI